jgi:hypothetical protein
VGEIVFSLYKSEGAGGIIKKSPNLVTALLFNGAFVSKNLWAEASVVAV